MGLVGVAAAVPPTHEPLTSLLAWPAGSFEVGNANECVINLFGSDAENEAATVIVYGLNQDEDGIIQATALATATATIGAVAGLSGLSPSDTEFWVDDIEVLAGDALAINSTDGSAAALVVNPHGYRRLYVAFDAGTAATMGYIYGLHKKGTGQSLTAMGLALTAVQPEDLPTGQWEVVAKTALADLNASIALTTTPATLMTHTRTVAGGEIYRCRLIGALRNGGGSAYAYTSGFNFSSLSGSAPIAPGGITGDATKSRTMELEFYVTVKDATSARLWQMNKGTLSEVDGSGAYMSEVTSYGQRIASGVSHIGAGKVFSIVAASNNDEAGQVFFVDHWTLERLVVT